MIHYFNPEHEDAVLNGSPFYSPKTHIAKMKNDLAFLPAWYASPGDCVLVPEREKADFRNTLDGLLPLAESITPADFTGNKEKWQNRKVNLWGISPAAIRLFEQYDRSNRLSLDIPVWKNEYRRLSSRFWAKGCLLSVMEVSPEIEKDIVPQHFSEIGALEDYLLLNKAKQIVKSPYSSSGRGLIWLPPEKLAQSERQIIGGILKKQSWISVEKALDKQLDFSMHFEAKDNETVAFIGYSVFQTNHKGAYQNSLLGNPNELLGKITRFVDIELLNKVKNALLSFLKNKYTPYYTGCIGVDMLIYRSENEYKLHPCVEINMRKSMGYLAIRLFENYIQHDSQGEFQLEYNPDEKAVIQKHRMLSERYPLVCKNRRIQSGYLSLCPVSEASGFFAYIVVNSLES
jgi:hypothetical protein